MCDRCPSPSMPRVMPDSLVPIEAFPQDRRTGPGLSFEMAGPWKKLNGDLLPCVCSVCLACSRPALQHNVGQRSAFSSSSPQRAGDRLRSACGKEPEHEVLHPWSSTHGAASPRSYVMRSLTVLVWWPPLFCRGTCLRAVLLSLPSISSLELDVVSSLSLVAAALPPSHRAGCCVFTLSNPQSQMNRPSATHAFLPPPFLICDAGSTSVSLQHWWVQASALSSNKLLRTRWVVLTAINNWFDFDLAQQHQLIGPHECCSPSGHLCSVAGRVSAQSCCLFPRFRHSSWMLCLPFLSSLLRCLHLIELAAVSSLSLILSLKWTVLRPRMHSCLLLSWSVTQGRQASAFSTDEFKHQHSRATSCSGQGECSSLQLIIDLILSVGCCCWGHIHI